MKTIEDVKAAPLTKLRDFYNAKSPNKRITKFVNREVAERRVLALIEYLRIKEEERLNPPSPPAPKIPVYRMRASRSVAFDPDMALPALDKPESDITEAEALAELQALKAASVAPRHTGKTSRQTLSESAKHSWEDPQTAEKRKTRHRVIVTVDGESTPFKSTHMAFIGLGLPVAKHINFRKQLKGIGKMLFKWNEKSYLFEIRLK